jgi:hypothetical protein
VAVQFCVVMDCKAKLLSAVEHKITDLRCHGLYLAFSVVAIVNIVDKNVKFCSLVTS